MLRTSAGRRPIANACSTIFAISNIFRPTATNIAVLEPARNSAHAFNLSRQGLLRRRTDLKIRRHDFNIAGYALALCGEHARKFHIEWIVPRKTVKNLQPLIDGRRQKDLCLHGDDGVGSRQQELFSPPIHETEQRNEEYGEHARHSNGPAKRRAAIRTRTLWQPALEAACG
jgi:hypothetical protein